MDIKYLTQLNDHPFIRTESPDVIFTLKPSDEAEIAELESTYNNAAPFPRALKELVLLAGNRCYVLSYGPSSSLKKLQESVRDSLIEYVKSIDIPFFAIDVYSGNEQFIFVYLNEGDDPIVRYVDLNEEETDWIRSTNRKLSDYINALTLKLLSGTNPY